MRYDGRRFKKIRAVFKQAGQLLPLILKLQEKVKTRHSKVYAQPLNLNTVKLQALVVRMLVEDEGHLKQRIPHMATFGTQLLDEHLERHVLVIKRFDRGIVDAAQELAKCWIAVT